MWFYFSFLGIQFIYRIRRCLVPLCLLPCKFYKILVVGNFIEQNFIFKILVFEINSRKIFLIFLFISYDTAIIKQSSSFFLKNYSLVCFCKLSMKLAKSISSFSSCTPDHLKSIAFSSLSGSVYCSVSSILIDFFSSSLFPSSYCY